jgi:hypothetical protein
MKMTYKIWLMMASLTLLVWVAACAQSDQMMDKNMQGDMQGEMTSEMAPMLMGSDGHHAAGTVSFGMAMGKDVLTLSDIKVDEIPDGYVFLTHKGDWMHGVELGPLKQFTGTVSFDLPDGVSPDDYDTVVIWCKQFHVEIGRATYGKKMM